MLCFSRFDRLTIHSLLAACVFTSVRAAGDRLNVRDFGASGSKFETTARTTAGSRDIVVADAGDFQVGQGVMVSRCHSHVERLRAGHAITAWGGEDAPAEEVEVRGFDGSLGEWVIYILDVTGDDPLTFRWSDDMGRSWKEKAIPITHDWQALSSGTEIRFNRRDMKPGYAVHFSARMQLLSTIVGIRGNTLELRDAPNRTVEDAVVRHTDADALQACIDAAIEQKKNVVVPVGYYRLHKTIAIRDADIDIEGASGVHTVLDISDGRGPCITLFNGTEVSIRNMRFVGHTPLGTGPGWRSIPMTGGQPFWPVGLKSCQAVVIRSTERVLLENCHATAMNCEAFYSQSRSRTGGRPEPRHYTKSVTYRHCSVEDSDGNAFNNNDHAENTSVLYCRIVRVGGCTWEGASRFVRFIGNYVRDAGPIAMGNIGSRRDSLDILPSGQHIVANNVFEGCQFYNSRPGGFAISAQRGATPVIIKDNIFVNYNSSGVNISAQTDTRGLPAAVATISGNIFDLTCVDETPVQRTAVSTNASHVRIHDNHVYVRGDSDPLVTAFQIREPAINLDMHNNLVHNCGQGLITGRAGAHVQEVIDPTTFLLGRGNVPFERRWSHLYRGWNLVWLAANIPTKVSTIQQFDPETCRFTLTEAHDMRQGDRFEVYPRGGANWTIHHNTFTGCITPVKLDSYGSPTSRFSDNTIERGETAGVASAIEVRGRFNIEGNLFYGFDEPDSCVLDLYPDRLGNPLRNIYRRNVFERCFMPFRERAEGLWEAAVREDNRFLDCGPELAAADEPPRIAPQNLPDEDAPEMRAGRLPASLTIDGDIGEWPWTDEEGVVTLEHTPEGAKWPEPRGRMCAAVDETALYLAMRVARGEGETLKAASPYQGDGIELSFRSRDPKQSTPIFVLWATTDGTFSGSGAMGATAPQVHRLEQGIVYAVKVSATEWTAEWKIPFAAMGLTGPPSSGFKLNVGLCRSTDGSWTAWVPTGGRVCDVDNAGSVRLGGK